MRMREPTLFHLFILISTLFLWSSSMCMMPTKTDLHVVNMIGIFVHYFYYLYFSKSMWIVYNIFTLVTVMIHFLHVDQMVGYLVVIFHVLHNCLLYMSTSTGLAHDIIILWMLILDILSKNFYIISYMMDLSSFVLEESVW